MMGKCGQTEIYLKIEQKLCGERIRLAADAAMLAGFQSEHMQFPVLRKEGIPLPASEEELFLLWRKQSEDGVSAPVYEGGKAPCMDRRKTKGMECLFTDGIFLEDTDEDTFPDRLNVKFVLPEEADMYMLSAICDLAFRFGMETTGIRGSIAAEDGYEGPAVVFSYGEENTIRQEGQRIRVSGQGEELARMMSSFCSSFPLINDVQTLADLFCKMNEDLEEKRADGQMARVQLLKEEGISREKITVYACPDLTDTQREEEPEIAFEPYRDPVPVFDRTWNCEWEADRFRKILEEQVYPVLRKGDACFVTGALSEDVQVRSELLREVKRCVEKTGASFEEPVVVNAYKQGLSWMREIVIPALKKMDLHDPELVIGFRPFLPEGQKEWKDESGVIPSYHNMGAGDPEHWFDLPIRYLQELYPVEDILVKELSMERERIVFVPLEDSGEETYTVCANDLGKECYRNSWTAWSSERPYLDAFPQMGKVHPSTGGICVQINGKEIVRQRIATDLEQVWEIYQKEVLPEVLRVSLEEHGSLTEEQQPFFHSLVLEASLSEEEERLESREDLLSPLDALHEDMYFAGTDFFKQYGRVNGKEMLDAPGLILPILHRRRGGAQLRAVLNRQKRTAPAVIAGERVYEGKETAELSVSGYAYRNGKRILEISAKDVDRELLCAYAQRIEEGKVQLAEEFFGYDALYFTDIAKEVPVKEQRYLRDRSMEDVEFPEDRVIGYEESLCILEQLKHVKGITVWKSAESYTGRKQYSLWLRPEREGYLSLTKYLNNHITEHINARHHANEVSSTNAAFGLLKRLMCDAKYRDLPEKLCLVMTPMENVDGSALHEELQKEHPCWKFHVARFNLLGKEYFHDSFDPKTIHTTALGFGHLYTRFVPDVCVDNHGVPSHEWEQQFAGYTSPSYKGFWLPRSLLYSYYWYVTEECYEGNRQAAKAMEDAIADAVEKDPMITRQNREWMHQFETFAHAWMPAMFPADYYRGMIDYWIPYSAGNQNKYPSCRYPWLTTVSYTSEVADETAQGDYLKLCSEAHVLHDLAVIDLLLQAECRRECRMDIREDGVTAADRRCRPFFIKENGVLASNS